MDASLLKPAAQQRRTSIRKPLGSKDPNILPMRKPSIDKSSLLVRRTVPQVATAAHAMPMATTPREVLKAMPRHRHRLPLTLDHIFHKHRVQEAKLINLQEDFATYKAETTKILDKDLHDRFEGISKHEVMTQFACKWFGILMVGHLIFLYVYFVLRPSSHVDDDDEVSTPREQVEDGLLLVSAYSFSYLCIVLFDIFWSILFPDRVRCERTTERTHVIVAAHRAHESLALMLPTVLRTFAPHCVWVADNGFADKNAEALCQQLGVHYDFNPNPNKANALVVVARKIKRRFGTEVENVVLLDDDTELEPDFFVRHDLLEDPSVGGYCVGIAINRSPPFNVWEIAIDFEYRAISHSFGARATCSTLPFCHGICAVYKLDLMIEMYSKNWSLPGGLPFGEDGYAGLDYRKAGYKLLQDNANVVLTYCPRRFFPPLFSHGRVQGYGASSLWKQRACRWFLSWPRQLPSEFKLFFTYRAGGICGGIQYRVYTLWWLFLNCVSVAWIPYMFYVWLKHESWILVLLLKGMLTVTGILVSFLRVIAFPSKLRRGVHPLAPFCSPILGMANSILRFFGFFFSLYWFIPFFRVNKLRVLGDDDNDGDDDIEDNIRPKDRRGESKSPVQNESETEEPTETEEYCDVDLAIEREEEITNAAVRRSWMQLLRDNLQSEDPMPSLTSYTTSSSSNPSSGSGSPHRHPRTRFEI